LRKVGIAHFLSGLVDTFVTITFVIGGGDAIVASQCSSLMRSTAVV
jgi:hypothetical protein